ncbi:MAG TPA: GNAT family N-acyltransferase [Bdellovibrionales bacterium]|nr:GNAT family N-acyltransferase [Bdellovibrionales bacterium]
MQAALSAKRFLRTFQEARQKKSLYARVREYRGFVPVLLETDDFRVRTAMNGTELLRVLELRHQVFIEEWQGRRAYHGLDVDGYDFHADHLIIEDKRVGRVVGTYRLLSSHFTHDFYSGSEFELGAFLRAPAVKLEMGRACVHRDHRNGNTIDLLWKGLSRYIAKTKTELLFGCSSVKTTDPVVMNRLYRTLVEQHAWRDDHQIRPNGEYRFPGFLIAHPQPLTPLEKRELMPPLLRSYLQAGAHVYGWPALDRDFACTDLLTILDWNSLQPRFRSRFT